MPGNKNQRSNITAFKSSIFSSLPASEDPPMIENLQHLYINLHLEMILVPSFNYISGDNLKESSSTKC